MKRQQLRPEMPSTDKSLRVRFLGSNVSYQKGMDAMRKSIARVQDEAENCCIFELLFLEHQDTITTTRQNTTTSLLKGKSEIQKMGIEVLETDRGGDVTFHGHGQLVGYLVVRLFPVDLIGYLRSLENALLESVRELGLHCANVVPEKTGIWVYGKDKVPQKLIAIGIGVSKGVTRHGFALNVSTNLERFTQCIVPCGLHGFGVTSLERQMTYVPSVPKICETIADQIAKKLGLMVQFEDGFSPGLSKLAD